MTTTSGGKQNKKGSAATMTTTTAPTTATSNPLSDVFVPPPTYASAAAGAKEAEAGKDSRSLRGSISNVAKTIKAPFVKHGHLGAPGRRVIDLSQEEQEAWEEVQLKKVFMK